MLADISVSECLSKPMVFMGLKKERGCGMFELGQFPIGEKNMKEEAFFSGRFKCTQNIQRINMLGVALRNAMLEFLEDEYIGLGVVI